jgi:DNA polymerase V
MEKQQEKNVLKKSAFLETEIKKPEEQLEELFIPLYDARVAAGFPSIAEYYVSQTLDLNKLIIEHPTATFFMRVKGDSMINAGIYDGDIVVVDRALTAYHGKVVIIRVENELTIKRFEIAGEQIVLRPENENYKPITITPDQECEVWGVVTFVIHKV